MKNYYILLRKINAERVSQDKPILSIYGKVPREGLGHCIHCQRETAQLRVFDYEVEQAVYLCLRCKNLI